MISSCVVMGDNLGDLIMCVVMGDNLGDLIVCGDGGQPGRSHHVW